MAAKEEENIKEDVLEEKKKQKEHLEKDEKRSNFNGFAWCWSWYCC